MKPFLSIRGPRGFTTGIKTNAATNQLCFYPKTTNWHTSTLQTNYQISFSKTFATEKITETPKKSTSTKKPKAPPKETSDAPFYELKVAVSIQINLLQKGEPVPSKPDQVKPVYTKKPVDAPTETKSPPKPASQNSKAAKKTRLVLNDKGEVVIPVCM